MILFFFNDSASSERDGERKVGTQRLDARRECNVLKGCIRANYDEFRKMSSQRRTGLISSGRGFCFALVVTVMLQL